jgi:hypothetical protein
LKCCFWKFVVLDEVGKVCVEMFEKWGIVWFEDGMWEEELEWWSRVGEVVKGKGVEVDDWRVVLEEGGFGRDVVRCLSV